VFLYAKKRVFALNLWQVGPHYLYCALGDSVELIPDVALLPDARISFKKLIIYYHLQSHIARC